MQTSAYMNPVVKNEPSNPGWWYRRPRGLALDMQSDKANRKGEELIKRAKSVTTFNGNEKKIRRLRFDGLLLLVWLIYEEVKKPENNQCLASGSIAKMTEPMA